MGVSLPFSRQIFFRSRCANNMPSDSSSSGRSSSSSSDSDSDSSSDESVQKFEVSKTKSTCVSGWVVTGLNESRAKIAREMFKPKFKKSTGLLTNPELDEAFYLRLKELKSSAASKANVDPLEKVYRNQTFKVLDLAKPLLFLASRVKKKKKSRAEKSAVRTALKLWAILYHDITKARRRNILTQIYPQNVGLLDDKSILPTGGEHLFGPKFTQALVEQVKTLNALNQASGGGRNGRSSQSSSGHNYRSGSSQHGSQQGTSSSGGQQQQNSNRYVPTSLAFPGSFGGQIARFASEWSKLTLDPWVLSTVIEGFRLEFLSEPVQHFVQPNATMDAQQFECCRQEVSSLLEKGAVVRATQGQGFISSIFLIAKRSGGFRPIINLRGLNQFLIHQKFKMEGISTVRHTVREGDWLAKLDLKDAYLTVPVYEGHRRFLRFKWGRDLFEFVSLPFGLSSAPWAFTKLLRVVVAYLRKNGLRLVIYLDDILIVADSESATRLAVSQIKALLQSLGFVISSEKSEEDPVQSLEYIGLIVNAPSMRLVLPDRKKQDILRLCKVALKDARVCRKDIEKIIGNLNWASAAVDFAPAHFRGLQILLNSHRHESGVFPLSVEAKSDLHWWLSEANFSAGRSLIFPSPEISIYSDASLSGWGAVYDDVRTGGPWAEGEIGQHINFLELLAALKALQCFTATLTDTAVELKIDNTSAVSYINRLGGCKSENLCSIALQISNWCELRRISLSAVFVPGVMNILADAESRKPLSTGDWKLDPRAFRSVQSVWNSQVDMFASSWNAQLPIFVSRFPQPGAWKTDALSVCWKDLAGFCFPPFSLIPFCLSKIRREKATIVLIAPFWPSQYWFPSLLELATDFPLLLPPSRSLLTSPLGEGHPLIVNGSLRLIAWRLSGVVSESAAFHLKLSSSYWGQLAQIHTLHISPPGALGAVGVLHGKPIPCRLASMMF